tara:strand:- start:1495 stop:2082 length:588 start_codon:yes stop_codon:yes gene_type:complete
MRVKHSFVISLSDERIKRFANINNVSIFRATDTRNISIKDICKIPTSVGDFSFDMCSVEEYKNYFMNNNGAIGCYISHVNLLSEIGKMNDNSWYLVLEDDINVIHLSRLLREYKNFNNLNYINLNYRGPNGSEAYAVRPSAAREIIKLIDKKITYPIDKLLFSVLLDSYIENEIIKFAHFKKIGLAPCSKITTLK